MASRQSAQGPAQYLALAAAAALARTQQPRKHLAVHPSELAIEPNLQILRRHCRSLLLRLEHPRRSTVENHVHRPARLGNRTSANMRIGITVLPTFNHRPSPTRRLRIRSATNIAVPCTKRADNNQATASHPSLGNSSLSSPATHRTARPPTGPAK